MKASVWHLLDAAAIFAVVGQFFGRIGNLINGDVIGQPTSLPWGITYANPNSFAPEHNVAYHPAAYEALLDVLLFAILWRLRNKLQAGILFFVYIIGYSIGQMVVFIWRDNQEVLWEFKQAQVTALAVMVVATIALVSLLKTKLIYNAEIEGQQ
jgi:phosphatidylglycerol---prolipoprotein diacylglyceryl transferase